MRRVNLAFQHQQSLSFQSSKTVNVPTSLHDGFHGGLAELAPFVGGFFLAARFGLAAPAWCDTSEDFAAVVRGEVDEARSTC